MGLLQTAFGLLRETRLVAALLICGVLAALSVIFYFRILRPRRGTTEWMQRLERSKATLFPAPKLCIGDTLWAAMSVVMAAVFQAVFLFFWLRLHLHPNPAAIVIASVKFFLLRMGLSAALALGIYLLLRCMFQGDMSAICPAALSGLLIANYVDTVILLVFSLLCLYLWMSTENSNPLFPWGLWLLASGALFGWASLTCPQVLWLLLFYLAAYVCKQVLRFLYGDPLRRGNQLIVSVAVTFAACIVGVTVLFLFTALLSHRYEGDFLENIRSPEFYKNILPLVKEKITQLFTREIGFRESILAKDSLIFIFGGLSAIPLLYGLFVRKELRCVWLLCLAVCFALPWLLCGIYLMNLPMLLLLGYAWDTYCRRERSFILPVYAVVLAGAYIALII